MSTIKKIIGSVILLFLLLGSVALSSLNATTVTLDLYWHSWEMPLGFMLLVFAAVGLLVGLVVVGVACGQTKKVLGTVIFPTQTRTGRSISSR